MRAGQTTRMLFPGDTTPTPVPVERMQEALAAGAKRYNPSLLDVAKGLADPSLRPRQGAMDSMAVQGLKQAGHMAVQQAPAILPMMIPGAGGAAMALRLGAAGLAGAGADV